MSSGGGVRSSGGSNQSSTGANESIRNSDGNPHPTVSASNPGSHPVSPEWTMQMGNTGGITQIRNGEFKGEDARTMTYCRHPSKEYDPASIKIPGSSM